MILKLFICAYLIIFGYHLNPKNRIMPISLLYPFQPIWTMVIVPILFIHSMFKIFVAKWDLEYLFYYFFNKDKLILEERDLNNIKTKLLPQFNNINTPYGRYKYWLGGKILEINNKN